MGMQKTSVKQNLLLIKQSLPSTVQLVAVSKTKPNASILEAYEAGQLDFGENYVQELLSKHEELPKEIRWHFIGHLQSNKVKYIAPFVYLIHGIDSFKLLQEVNRQAAKNKRIIPCLLQIHIAVEETKFGFSIQECGELLNSGKLKERKNVNIIGLMAMASNTDDKKWIRKEYRELATFYKEAKLTETGWTVLSCGMSSDYQLAIEEGSTMVLIGSSVFGERSYPAKN